MPKPRWWRWHGPLLGLGVIVGSLPVASPGWRGALGAGLCPSHVSRTGCATLLPLAPSGRATRPDSCPSRCFGLSFFIAPTAMTNVFRTEEP